mmetsp:Transcript_13820/g.25900  ORF Transcript_13820/g.25900 Transcript_13820/m.25900 type:complete len:266 (+) Transcript_13820:80-877(+)
MAGKPQEPVVKGRTLAYPVAADWKPDLRGNLDEINQYLEEQGGYDICDYLLKDLMIKQPADPLQHMLDCLQKGYPRGPLKILVSSPPGLGRERFARRLAESKGLMYIGAGELLREAGFDTARLCYAEDEQVSKLVLELVRQAEQKMQGFVVDGFPRTPWQTAFLKEKAVVPTHVLLLKASEEFLQKRQQGLADGTLEGKATTKEVFDQRLKMHIAHNALALGPYADMTFAIEAEGSDDEVFSAMEKHAKTPPKSKAPRPPPPFPA